MSPVPRSESLSPENWAGSTNQIAGNFIIIYIVTCKIYTKTAQLTFSVIEIKNFMNYYAYI